MKKMFVYTGHDTEDGKRLMANKGCACGGRGFTKIVHPNGYKHPVKQACKCLRTCSMPIDWIELPK